MNEEFKKYTKEDLERILLYNTIIHGLAEHKTEETYTQEINTLNLQSTADNARLAQSYLTMGREGLRPHKLYPTDVFWSTQDSKFICRLPFMEMEEEGEGIAIFAYGDTPAQACDNFDHQWIHGNGDD